MNSQCKYRYVVTPPDQPLRLDWDKLAGRRCAKNICAANPAHNCSGKRLGNLHLVLPSTVSQDFVWTWYSDCLIQDKVLHRFLSEGFTGFQPRPVHLRWEHPSDQPLPKLWELEVTGWAGMARPESGIRLLERCAVCGRQIYTSFATPAFLVDSKQWDGSDFFMVWPMPRFIFVTERVASFLQAEGLTGASAIELHQMRIPRGFSPGGLRDWMADDRARQLADNLGIY